MWIEFVRRADGAKALALTLAVATASVNVQPLPVYAGSKQQQQDSGSSEPVQAPYDAEYPTLKPSPYANPEADEDEAPLKPGTLEYAKAQVEVKDYKGALITYKTLFMASPYDADILLGIAYCAERLGDLDEAVKYARQASQAEPKSPETHIALGHYLEENRDLKAAYLQYSRALDLKPDPDLMEQIFAPTLRILMSLNDIPDAVRLAHKWAHDFSKNANCQYNNGWVLSQCGDDNKKLSEAVLSYQTAIDLDPGLVGAHYNLALLQLKLSQTDEAISELNLFIKLAPNDPDCKQAKVLLAKLKAPSAPPVAVTKSVPVPAKATAGSLSDSVSSGKSKKSVSLPDSETKSKEKSAVTATAPKAKKLASAEPAEVKANPVTVEPSVKSDAAPASESGSQKSVQKKRSKWEELHSKESFNR
jgi:tetratricopeptide (TPR) repeat protein